MKVSDLKEELNNYDDDVEVEMERNDYTYTPDFYVDDRDVYDRNKPNTIYIRMFD